MDKPRKVWFITGASTGFGRAFAEYAIDQGYAVVASARSADKLAALRARAPDQVEAIPMDVTKPEDTARALAQAAARFGGVDVLINNAGYGLVGAVEEISDAELRAIMDTNFFGAATLIRQALPQFRERGSGAIVNITSLGGQLSIAGYSAYSASKFALEGLSEALAQEMRPFGVKVLIVEPGSFRTEFSGASLKTVPSLPAYASTVGEAEAATRAHDKKQPGDPYKAAAAIDKALSAENTPLRLQLGADAIGAVKGHAEALLKELDEWKALGAATTF